MSKPRLLYVVHSLCVGGTEVIVAELAKKFSSEYEIGILTLDQVGKLAVELADLKISIFCINRQAGWKFRNFQSFFQAIKDFKPDLIHAHQYTPLFFSVSAKLCLQTAAKLIFTEHGRHFPDYISWKRKIFNLIIWLIPNKITAVCKFTAKALQKNDFCYRDIQIIYNGINKTESSLNIDLRNIYNLPQNTFLICYLGSFRKVKNPLILPKLIKQILAWQQNVALVMIGAGELRSELELMIADLGLDNHVFLHGEVREMSRLWHNFDCFVQPSLSEANSLALLEAMSQGVVPIVSRVGGATEVVQNEVNGLVFESNNLLQLSDCLRKLIISPETRNKLASAARLSFDQKFQAKIMIEKYSHLYRLLLNHKE